VTNTVLVLTSADDVHADIVCAVMAEKSCPIARFHPDDFPLSAGLTAEVRPGGFAAALRVGGELVDLNSIGSIWYRRPSRPQLPDWPAGVREFGAAEAEHAVTGLLTALSHAFWVSRPDRIRRASYKIAQLGWAQKAGFQVPETIVTNDPAQARHFYEEHRGKVVYKTLCMPFIQHSPELVGALYTTPIGPEQAREFDRVSVLPCQFQEYLEKRLEIRATVIGDSVYSASIDASGTELGRHDWRRYEPGTVYSRHTLPGDIEEACLRLVRMLDLQFGAIDLVLKPDGTYVFLEINPNGQWAFVEQVTGLPLAEAIVQLLTRPSDKALR
jgi:glutathione synthase/RimK-type ligase-like ATP-grasp enzyme